MDATIEMFGKQDAIACWRRGLANLAENPRLDFEIDRTNSRALARFGWS